ncbi:MAG: ABC transporter permease [Chloroflexi bacterium]|nr:ABC transporter permease [Chloroflexota bacterium]
MRTGLTMLGVIIGVASVIAMVSIGESAKNMINNSIKSLGSNVMMIFPGTTTAGGVRGGHGSITTLTVGDAEAIARECPSVSAVSPDQSTVAQVVYENQNWSTQINGVGPDFVTIRNWDLASGKFIDQTEVNNLAKVCVLGNEVKQELFGDIDPLDKVVRIKKIPFRVIGVMAVKGSSMGRNQDDVVIIPYSTCMARLMGVNYLSHIMASAVDEKGEKEAQQEITLLLRQRHRITEEKDDDFGIRTQAEISQAAAQTTGVMILLLGGIAAVSLIVGGIGIMNIMLVSVTERTREIGVRMAVGARPSDILKQFLIESVMISLLGGVVGILLGIGLAAIFSAALKWPLVIAWNAIMLAVFVSAFVGIAFGVFPARKASHLDPIYALRYE